MGDDAGVRSRQLAKLDAKELAVRRRQREDLVVRFRDVGRGLGRGSRRRLVLLVITASIIVIIVKGQRALEGVSERPSGARAAKVGGGHEGEQQEKGHRDEESLEPAN